MNQLGQKVLLVDSNPESRKLRFNELVRTERVEVFLAHDFRSALRQVKLHSPDKVFISLSPDDDLGGSEVLIQLLNRHYPEKFIRELSGSMMPDLNAC